MPPASSTTLTADGPKTDKQAGFRPIDGGLMRKWDALPSIRTAW